MSNLTIKVLELVEDIDDITNIRLKEPTSPHHKVFRFTFRKPMSEDEQNEWIHTCGTYMLDGEGGCSKVQFDWRNDSEVEVEVK